MSTLVTVVDASTFLKEFEKRNKVNQRSDLGSNDFSEMNHRQVVDLMCEQIECADILILNKVRHPSCARGACTHHEAQRRNPRPTHIKAR